MKKLLVLIACAWTISMHAMEVNEQSARAFVIYKGIKQLIMNPPIVPCIGDLDVQLLNNDQRSELAQLALKEYKERYSKLWTATMKATIEHKMDMSFLEADYQFNNLSRIEKSLTNQVNLTKN